MPSFTPADALIQAADNLVDTINGSMPKSNVTSDTVEQLTEIYKSLHRLRLLTHRHLTTGWCGCPAVVQPHNVQCAPLNQEDFVVAAKKQTMGVQEFGPNFLPGNYCTPRFLACALVCVLDCALPSRPASMFCPSPFASNPLMSTSFITCRVQDACINAHIILTSSRQRQ